MPATLVIGHRNPDTDAICSALGYAAFRQATGHPDTEAVRCGEPNVRTQFALERAGLPSPRLVTDVRATVGDLDHQAVSAREDEPVNQVFHRMRERGFRSLPVLDLEGRLRGLVSMSKLVELLLPDPAHAERARIVTSTLGRIRDIVNGDYQSSFDTDVEEELIITVAALSAEKFNERLRSYPAQRLAIVCGDRPTVQKAAIDYGVRAIVVTGGYRLGDALASEAATRGVTVISSPYDTAATTILIRTSKRIDAALEQDLLTFAAGDVLRSVADRVRESSQPLFPVVDGGRRLLGVFSKSDLVEPPRTRLILVDHNEYAQAVEGAREAEILEVLDHHRLGGGLTTREPIRFVVEPVGSTCTLVARLHRQHGVALPSGLALALAAGVISDTLYLTSPTTTDVDREILGWLRDAHRLDLDRFAEQFFAADSALLTQTPEQIVRTESKPYQEAGWKFVISQVEELGLERFWNRADSLARALDDLRAAQQHDFACLMITDISAHESYLLFSGDARVLAAIDYPQPRPGLFHLSGVVSRKKQFLPHLTRILAGVKMEN